MPDFSEALVRVGSAEKQQTTRRRGHEEAEVDREGLVRREISRAAGKIICISSVHEIIPWAGHVNYAASKGTNLPPLRGFVEQLIGMRR